MHGFPERLVARAAAPYRSAGHTPYHFARGKLSQDPVFFALLRQGLMPAQGHLTDLGCGQGSLIAILLAARDAYAAGDWPADWPAPPGALQLTGVDLRPAAVRSARAATGGRARIEVGDVRTYPLPASNVIAILDVLHYISAAEQRQVLERCHAALAPGGRLLLRAGDAAAGWRFTVTRIGDQLITMLRGALWPRFCCRTATEWQQLLADTGFTVRMQPMSEGTPFANVLFVADRR